jgi:hypothetical protein
VVAACLEAGYEHRQCEQLGAAVRSSLRGNLGRRPGALCRALGACAADASCNVTVKSSITGLTVTAAVDTCTIDGVAGGAVAGANSTAVLPAGQCKRDSDCGAKQQCQRLPGASVHCNCEGGRDKCTPVGTCTDFCSASDVKQAVAAINSKVGCRAAALRADCPRCAGLSGLLVAVDAPASLLPGASPVPARSHPCRPPCAA